MNSRVFTTEHVTDVEDILTSLILTCQLNGVDARDCLLTHIRKEAAAPDNIRSDILELQKGAIAECRLRRCRINSAKGRDEVCHFGKAIIKIKRELMRLDGIERQVRMVGPPAQELAER